MSTETWKLEKDLCRCCHSEGSFRNLSESYTNEGQDEVISDMLQFSLDLNISPITGVQCFATCTVCEECIERIRDATNFKRQVLQCEEKFRDMYVRNVMKVPALVPFTVKKEISEQDPELEEMKSDVLQMDPVRNDDFTMNYVDVPTLVPFTVKEEVSEQESEIEVPALAYFTVKEEVSVQGPELADFKSNTNKSKPEKQSKTEKKVGRPRKSVKKVEVTADEEKKDRQKQYRQHSEELRQLESEGNAESKNVSRQEYKREYWEKHKEEINRNRRENRKRQSMNLGTTSNLDFDSTEPETDNEHCIERVKSKNVSRQEYKRQYWERHKEEINRIRRENRKRQSVNSGTTTNFDSNNTELAIDNKRCIEQVDDNNALKKKRERQRRYRELHREKLRQREIERRQGKKMLPLNAAPCNSTNVNTTQLNDEAIMDEETFKT
ncbi:uncharacterized protein ACR2FA_008380 [Aphomia sociella]